MPLSKPSYPVYDADTFNKLKDLVDVFFANDEYLETIAGGGGGGVATVTTTNWNTITDTGFYESSQTATGVVANNGNRWSGIHIEGNGNRAVQIMSEATATDYHLLYIRYRTTASVWQAWKLVNGPEALSRIDVTLASGYTNNANYVNLRTVKVGPQVTLETGVTPCPASFAAATYYTVGTVDSAHRPTDGKMRMGVAHLYRSTGGTVEIWPLQMRINTSGQIQILSPAARANVDYLLLGQLSWNV